MLWLSVWVDDELRLVKYVEQYESAEACWEAQELLNKATENRYNCLVAQSL